jgi:hypothetical protein
MPAQRDPRFPPVVMEVPPGSPRNWDVLIFLHIPKTAGLNLRHIINYQYGMADVCAPEAGQDVTRSQLFRYLETGKPLAHSGPGFDPNGQFRKVYHAKCADLAGLRAVFGHLWYGFHDAIPGPTSYMTVLRDPVERAISVYYHRTGRHGLRVSLEDWVRTARDYELDNGQTRRLCGRLDEADIRFTPCTSQMLERAKKNLKEHFSVVGIAERFEESLLLMARKFDWRVTRYKVYNVNRDRPRGVLVPGEIRQAVRERNQYDVLLYDYAYQLFDEQLRRIEPPIDASAIRRLRPRVAIGERPLLGRLYPVAAPMFRGARSIGRRARRILAHRSSPGHADP